MRSTYRVKQRVSVSHRALRQQVRGRNIRRRTPERELAASTAPSRKATSEDFLNAAHTHADNSTQKDAIAESAATAYAETPAPLAIHGTARPDEPSPTHSSSSVSRPVAVVSVIRPTAQKPQLTSVEEAASTPVILPTLYNKRGRLIVPPPLKGSHEILVHQNEVADRDGLQRIQSDDDLLSMRSRGYLVAVPVSAGMQVDERLPGNRRFCRPWTAQFLATLARAHYAHFRTPLQINSAVRTVEFQQHLLHINGNAAPAEGDTASPHLTGQAIDLAKHGLSLTEIAWLRGYLLPLVQEGKVDVEEEFQQSCFHISVYKRYLPSANTPQRDVVAHRAGTPTLAAAMQ